MKEFFNLIIRVFKDDRGIAPALVAALIMGGSTALGGALGNKSSSNVKGSFGPITGIGTAEQLEQMIQKGLQTGATPLPTGYSFDIPQTGLESLTEQTLLNQLGNIPQLSGNIQEIGSKVYSTQKAKLAESYAEEQKKTADMYNRLGLVSSTPGLAAKGELYRKQAIDEEALSAQIAQNELNLELAAIQMQNQALNNILGQATTFGGLQRSDARTTQQLELADLYRMMPENSPYLSNAQSFLGLLSGGNQNVSAGQNIWSQLGQTGQDIGSLLLLSQLMKTDAAAT